MPDNQLMSAEGLGMERPLMRVTRIRGSSKLWPRITAANGTEMGFWLVLQTVNSIREADTED